MIRITHARLMTANIPTFGVCLNITIPDNGIEEARRLIREQFHADKAYLTYEEI